AGAVAGRASSSARVSGWSRIGRSARMGMVGWLTGEAAGWRGSWSRGEGRLFGKDQLVVAGQAQEVALAGVAYQQLVTGVQQVAAVDLRHRRRGHGVAGQALAGIGVVAGLHDVLPEDCQ